ncbi:MAG: hypothetical protein AAGC85_02675 [Bacteroidota bacterium]
MKRLLILFLSLAPVLTFSQTDEINISAAFTTSISLKIDGSPNVEWTVTSIDQYKNGFMPNQRLVPFSVSASVNWRVEISNTDFVSPEGNSIDLRNVGYRVTPRNNDVKAEYNSRFIWGTKDGEGHNAGLSGLYIASDIAKTIIEPGPAGNAGNYDQNAFILRIGLASYNIRDVTGFATLLDQNIAPGTYSATVRLEALPVFE